MAPQDLSEFEQTLPPPPQPVGSYVPVVRTGNLLMTSGVLPMKDGQLYRTGQVEGFDGVSRAGGGSLAEGGSISGGITETRGVSIEDAAEAARLCIVNALSILKGELGSLTRIRQIVKVTGFVSSPPDFYRQPTVMNGASDFLVEVFGEAVGKHARSAVGVAALPLNAPVEIELIVEVV